MTMGKSIALLFLLRIMQSLSVTVLICDIYGLQKSAQIEKAIGALDALASAYKVYVYASNLPICMGLCNLFLRHFLHRTFPFLRGNSIIIILFLTILSVLNQCS
jgi:hypothetical protein